jgi:hypothetical protein
MMSPEQQQRVWASLPRDVWLAGAAGRGRYDVIIEWGSKRAAMPWIPCGVRWAALRAPHELGLAALDELRDSPAAGVLGPVLFDQRGGSVYWLLSMEPDSGATWSNMGSDLELLSVGRHLACPTPMPHTLARVDEHPARWVHWPSVTGVLTPPAVLARVLQEQLALEAEA